jgi:hypothetical protein
MNDNELTEYLAYLIIVAARVSFVIIVLGIVLLHI